MFIPCGNYGCSRAGWCKRTSYPFTPAEREKYTQIFECHDDNGWAHYVRNKAREIYERENPNDAFRNDEFEQEEHQNNNREPGLREDDQVDNRTEESRGRGYPVVSDSCLQLLRGSHRRSNYKSIFELMQILQEDSQEGYAILQDIARDGISHARSVSTEPDDAPAAETVRQADINACIRRAEAPEWFGLEDF